MSAGPRPGASMPITTPLGLPDRGVGGVDLQHPWARDQLTGGGSARVRFDDQVRPLLDPGHRLAGQSFQQRGFCGASIGPDVDIHSCSSGRLGVDRAAGFRSASHHVDLPRLDRAQLRPERQHRGERIPQVVVAGPDHPPQSTEECVHHADGVRRGGERGHRSQHVQSSGTRFVASSGTNVRGSSAWTTSRAAAGSA